MGILDTGREKSDWEKVLENSEEEFISENEEDNTEKEGEERKEKNEEDETEKEDEERKEINEEDETEKESEEKKEINEEDEREKKTEEKRETKQKKKMERKKEEQEIEIPVLKLPNPTYGYKNNVSVFCFSQQGESHKIKNIPCQDRSAFQFVGKNIVIAAVADGVGSCTLSDIGAEEAVNASLNYLEMQLKPLAEKEEIFLETAFMSKMLREMMSYAYDSVQKKAEELQQIVYTMQSTLTVAVYDGKTLFFAHAGDDGIVALNKSGDYALVTSRHKGEEASSVYPLQSKMTWQYGKVDDAVGFVMATDGVLDAFVRPESEKNRVYYPFIEPIFTAVQKNEEDAKQNGKDWYEYMASKSYRERVTDDLSFIGVVNQCKIEETIGPEFSVEKWNEESRKYEKKRIAALYPDRESRRNVDEKKKKSESPKSEIIKNNRKNIVCEEGTIMGFSTSKIISVLEEGKNILEDQINQISERFFCRKDRKSQENEEDQTKK